MASNETTFRFDACYSHRTEFDNHPDFNDNFADLEVADHETTEEEPGTEQLPRRSRRVLEDTSNLPPVPDYIPFQHPQPEHKRTLRIPVWEHEPRPIDYFKLFFPDEEFEGLAAHSNAYRADNVSEAQKSNGR